MPSHEQLGSEMAQLVEDKLSILLVSTAPRIDFHLKIEVKVVKVNS